MLYSVVFAFFIITHGVERSGRRRSSCRGRHAGQERDGLQETDVLDLNLYGTIRYLGCRSLDGGALQGRRAHEALGVAAGDGCELLVTPGDVGAVAQASRGTNQRTRAVQRCARMRWLQLVYSIQMHIKMLVMNKGMSYAP